MFRILLTTLFLSLSIGLFLPNNAYSFFYFSPEEETEKKASEDDESTNKGGASNNIIQRSSIKMASPTDAFMQKNEDLKHYLPKGKAQSILAGTQEYVIVEESSFTQNNKGVAILLPDWQQGLTNPKSINFLRKELPHLGWSTLSIQPSNIPTNYPSTLLDDKQRMEANTKALDEYQAQLKILMTAVMEKAKNYPGIFLVITQGGHAGMLTRLYKENNSLIPSAFIMLSAGMNSTTDNQQFAQNIAMSELPTLDLVLRRDNKTVTQNANLRQKLATKEMKVYYRQKQLYNLHTGYYPEQTLLTEINGWLKTIGW